MGEGARWQSEQQDGGETDYRPMANCAQIVLPYLLPSACCGKALSRAGAGCWGLVGFGIGFVPAYFNFGRDLFGDRTRAEYWAEIAGCRYRAFAGAVRGILSQERSPLILAARFDGVGWGQINSLLG